MFELNDGAITFEGKVVTKLAASLLGDAAIEKERAAFTAAMTKVEASEPFQRAMEHYMKAENIYERGVVFNQKTEQEVKDAWDFWTWFEGRANDFLERLPNAQGCGWAAYKADASEFTFKAYQAMTSDPNIAEVLGPFGYIGKMGNLALRMSGDLELDADDLEGEELSTALESATRPQQTHADPITSALQAMGLM